MEFNRDRDEHIILEERHLKLYKYEMKNKSLLVISLGTHT